MFENKNEYLKVFRIKKMSYQGTFLEKYTEKYGLLQTLEEYDRTKESRVFREFAKVLSGSYSLIDSFNNWVDNIFEKQVTSQSFTAKDGTKIQFTNPKIHKPVIMIDNKEHILYPQYCRDNNYPYEGNITVNCITTNKKGEAINIDFVLGSIPIMIGSKLCNLYGKTEEELVELKECISDPFGYFILRTERSVVIQDKKRMNVPMCFLDKKLGKIVCEYVSCATGKVRSKKFVMSSGKKWGTIKINDNYEKSRQFDSSKNIPIFVVFKLLKNIDAEEAFEKYVMKFIPEKFKRRCINKIESSVIKAKNIEDYVIYLCRKRREKYFPEKREEFIRDFKRSMIENLFPNISGFDEEILIELKLNLLSYIMVRYTLVVLGVVEMDSRDSWVNKRFDTAGTNIKILFASVLNALIDECVRDIEKYSSSNYSNFGTVLRSKSTNRFKKDFPNSFNTCYWGTNTYGTRLRENVVEATKRDTPLALWAMAVKNNNAVSRHDTKMGIREVHSSQRDKHCVSETPEGQNVSLVKYLTVTCRISLDTKEELPVNYISDNIGNMGDIVNGTKCDMILMINGKFTSYPEKNIDVIYCNQMAKNRLHYGKVHGDLSIDIEIYFDELMNCLQVYTDSSRATSPYFIINSQTNNLIIDEINGWSMSYDELIKSGAVEFLSARESDYHGTLISYSVENFYKIKEQLKNMPEGSEKDYYKKIKSFTHCNIDPNQLFSTTTLVCPMTNRQSAPRSSFQASMAKQALGYFNINYHVKIYGKKEGFKRLHRATRPICETDGYFLPKMDIMPAGQTAFIGFLTETDNQEDSVIVSEDFINTGNLNYIKYIMVHYTQPSLEVGVKEVFQKPPLEPNDKPDKYEHIDENGFPKLDTFVKEGDCLIGKILVSKKKGTVNNNSLYCGLGEEGYVDRIIVTKEKDKGSTYIKIKLRKYRKYRAGDKLAIRYAQKGTIGRVEKRENMIRISSGMNKGVSPDIIFNPLGFPSRMTVGLLMEGLLTKAAVYEGKRIDVSAFREIDFEHHREVLEKSGLDKYGYEEVELPDGTKLENKICIVPIYEQILKHHVLDKIQMRSSGVKSLYTHQPKGGRAHRGGQKIGEMEKDSFVAHGAAGVITERLMKVSDEFKIVVCQNCGIIINNKKCVLCDNSQPGILTVPYVFKLLIHLMNGTGMDIRIKTKQKTIMED